MRSRDEPDELFMAHIITHLLQQISNLMYARGCFNTLVYAYYVVFVDRAVVGGLTFWTGE